MPARAAASEWTHPASRSQADLCDPGIQQEFKSILRASKGKIAIRLGFTAVLEPPHVRADAILPDSKAFAEPAQSTDEPEGPNLPLAQALLQSDTVQFRHNNEAIEFPTAAGS